MEKTGFNLAEAIQFLKSCNQTHIEHETWILQFPLASNSHVVWVDAVGGVDHHLACIEMYEKIIAWMEGLEDG